MSRYDGLMTADHAPQPGARIMELKLCENCPNTFVRHAQSGIKYCGPCRGNQLMPLNLDDYREELASTDHSSKHSNKLPKYDDSLLPKKNGHVNTSFLPAGIQRRKRRDYGDWRQRLLLAFASTPRMTSEEMQDVIGIPGIPSNAVILARGMIVRVGWMPRIPGITKGHGLGIYSLAGSLTQ